MNIASKFAWVGNKILSFIAAVLIFIMLLYGGYSLWNTIMIYRGAFSSNELLKYQPTGDGPNSITLGELMKKNKDVVGWLTIFDTHISYPIVQGKDNQEYLNKDVFGEFSLSGSIFLDYRNARDFSDSYSIVYGHHMEYGAMLGDVVEFKNSDYFEKHEKGALFLTDDTYEITLFACVETQEFNNIIYNPTAQNENNLNSLLQYIKEKSIQYRDISLRKEDKIIGISTCAEAGTNERVVLFGRLDE